MTGRPQGAKFQQTIRDQPMLGVDGKELAQLMVEHSVGVTVSRTYELKRLDLDYFVTEDEEAAAESLAPSLPDTTEPGIS